MKTDRAFFLSLWTRLQGFAKAFLDTRPGFPFSLYEEAVSQMQTNLSHLCRRKNLKILLITSAVPGEGKSTVAANLALALSRQGRKVLLVDMDLRKPSLHRLFPAASSSDVGEILTGHPEGKQDFGTYELPQGIYLVPGGSPLSHPEEAIHSPRLASFLEAARMEFHLVVLDSAPVLSVADTAALSRLVDGVLFVLRAGTTKTGDLKRAREVLEKGGNREVIGVVMNHYAEKEQYHHYAPYAPVPRKDV